METTTTSDVMAQNLTGEYNPNSGSWPCMFCGCYVFNCCCGGINIVDICYCHYCGASRSCGSTCYCQSSCWCPVCLSYYYCNDTHICWDGGGSSNDCYCPVHYIYYDCSLSCIECYIGNNGGGGGGGGTPPPPPPATTPTSQAATRIISNARITPATVHQSTVVDNANARQNLIDAANGLLAKRSSYTDEGITGPGGETALTISLFNGIEYLAARFEIDISEIAGGVHSPTSSHYDGNTMDVNSVDDVSVRNMDPSQCQAFEDSCRVAGRTYILKESSHYHIKF
jgi:hypothetical protein